MLASPAFAIAITGFKDTDTAIKRSQDIIIAECVAIPTNKPVMKDGHEVIYGMIDGLYKVEVNILRTLKGGNRPGRKIIATIYPMTPGKTYLLSSMGGGVGPTGEIPATDFMTVPELSVVEIPADFDLAELDGGASRNRCKTFSRVIYTKLSRRWPRY